MLKFMKPADGYATDTQFTKYKVIEKQPSVNAVILWLPPEMGENVCVPQFSL